LGYIIAKDTEPTQAQEAQPKHDSHLVKEKQLYLSNKSQSLSNFAHNQNKNVRMYLTWLLILERGAILLSSYMSLQYVFSPNIVHTVIGDIIFYNFVVFDHETTTFGTHFSTRFSPLLKAAQVAILHKHNIIIDGTTTAAACHNIITPSSTPKPSHFIMIKQEKRRYA
jgi:hypothetical protein